ncbi:unnamed protein product [Amoebophrya sp. A120]|nr:unnamed protein product [Amoebophrya sp. A120]|eukprot:GSA120T00023050001.1
MSSAASTSVVDGGATTGGAAETGRLLDGFLVLASGGFGLPDDAVVANLSSLDIVEVSDDMRFFPNLDSMDLSDNKLNYREVLEHLFVTPRLTTLNLSCNHISRLNCRRNPLSSHISSFDTLASLDLSYNELHGDVLIALACLPQLEKLNLTANCISSIPPEESLDGFPKLSSLVLDSNDLVQFDQWRSLDCLRNLKHLSLKQNRIRRLREDEEEQLFVKLEVLELQHNDFQNTVEAVLTTTHDDGTGGPGLVVGSTSTTSGEGGGTFGSATHARRIEAEFSLLQHFPALRAVRVSQPGFPKKLFRGRITVETEHVKKFYMTGNGSHAARDKKQQVTKTRRAFRQVRPARLRQSSPSTALATRNAEGTQRLGSSEEDLQKALYTDTLTRVNERTERMAAESSSPPGAKKKLIVQPVDLIGKYLDDDTMDEIFARRRKQIDQLVEQRLQQEQQQGGGPTSFLQAIPFALSSDSQSMLSQAAKESSTFVTQQADHDGSQNLDYFARYREEEILETPRTPVEVRQQNRTRRKNAQSMYHGEGAGPPVAGAVDIPIDIRRSLSCADGSGSEKLQAFLWRRAVLHLACCLAVRTRQRRAICAVRGVARG